MVAELLRRNKDHIELIDARTLYLPLFTCRPGLVTWGVFDSVQTRTKGATSATAVPEAQGEYQGQQPPESHLNPSGIESRGETSSPDGTVSTDELTLAGLIRYASHVEVPAFDSRRLRASLFPPSDEEASWMHLGRSLPE